MTKEKPAIYGAKGGGTSSVTQNVFVNPNIQRPTISRDNLQSKAFARILDLISEGEIEGLVDGNKSIYLDDTPLESETGVNNFLGITTETRTGTQDQTYIEGFSNVENENPVGLTVEAANSLFGTWERPTSFYNLSSYTTNTGSSTVTVTWSSHGLTTGDKIFLNFEKAVLSFDGLYEITVTGTDTFTVTSDDKPDFGDIKPVNGNVYALKPYLKINASTRDDADWTARNIYLTFLRQSTDISRTKSSIWATRQTGYNKVYAVIPAEDIEGAGNESSSYFYIDWLDPKGVWTGGNKLHIDGGQINIADATYSYDKALTLLAITAPNHGYTSGMTVALRFRTGPLRRSQARTITVLSGTTNTIFAQLTGFSSTGGGEYFVEVPRTSAAITRQITNSEVDRVRFNISVPSLQRQFTDTGDIRGSEFTFAIDFQYNGGGFFEAKNETIKGKTTGGFSFSRELSFAGYDAWDSATISNNFPIDIRVRRVDEDSESAAIVNAFTWQSYTEIIDTKLRYPNSALVALELDAQQFNSIPSRTYHVKGIKVRIPSNATVNSITGSISYTGIWDGTFGAAAWTSDPAWILWDVLTSTRYGFGNEILTTAEKASFDGNASRLDKWSFYAASQYSSEFINTVIGSTVITEPRFSCNVSIQSRQQAFTLVNQLLSVFRTQAFWSNNSVVLAQDRPHDSSYAFGASNVVNGDFSYSGSDIKTRPTVVLVRYQDQDTRDVATEVVEDAALIEKYGIVTEELDAFACTSRGQAARVGRWLLYTNSQETETVSFSIGIESGVVLRPGMVISVSDPTRAGTRLSGRVSSATTTTVVLDVDRTVAAGDTLSVVLPDGLLESRTVSSYDSGTRTVTVSSAFSLAPQQNAVWLLVGSSVEPTTWRVISIAEDPENGVYGVTALSYNSGKFDYVEAGEPLQEKKITVIGDAPPAPAALSFSESLYTDNQKVFVRVSVGWEPSERAVAYQFRYRVDEGNWIQLPETATSQVDIENAIEGNWEVEVTAISVVGKKSLPASTSYEVVGKTANPEDVEALRISQIDQKLAELSWPAAVDLDVLVGGKVIIRHSSKTTGVVWRDSVDIIPAVAGNQTAAYVPLLAGTYLARFEDSTGNRSVNEVSVVVTLPDPETTLVVDEWDETYPVTESGESWTIGSFADTHYNAERGGVILNQTETIDEVAVDGDFDGLGLIDALGGTISSGEFYDFFSVNAGVTDHPFPSPAPGVFDFNIRRRLFSQAFMPGDLWDERIDPIDTWDDIDASALDAVNAEMYIRTSTDEFNELNPTFTEWEPLINGTRQLRSAQFKLVMTSSNPSQNIVVKEYGATMTLPARTELAEDVTSGAGSKAVTFANAFFQTPSIGISAQDMQSGDYYELSSVSRTGFTVTFKDSGGSAVSRTFDWQAVGHGKQLA